MNRSILAIAKVESSTWFFESCKLYPSNFKIWSGSEIRGENLVKQLDAFINPDKEGSKKDNFLFELMLKANYLLTDKVEKVGNLLVSRTVNCLLRLIALIGQLTKK